jgi:hypothetical protein
MDDILQSALEDTLFLFDMEFLSLFGIEYTQYERFCVEFGYVTFAGLM